MSNQNTPIEQEIIWAVLAENYNKIAYKFLTEIWDGINVDYTKTDYYVELIMEYWSNDAIIQTIRTWIDIIPDFDYEKSKKILYFTHNRLPRGIYGNRPLPEDLLERLFSPK